MSLSTLPPRHSFRDLLRGQLPDAASACRLTSLTSTSRGSIPDPRFELQSDLSGCSEVTCAGRVPAVRFKLARYSASTAGLIADFFRRKGRFFKRLLGGLHGFCLGLRGRRDPFGSLFCLRPIQRPFVAFWAQYSFLALDVLIDRVTQFYRCSPLMAARALPISCSNFHSMLPLRSCPRDGMISL